MTIVCTAPDESLGLALRLSGYLGCQAQALGENGFEALTGGPIVTGMLSGAITIFVALIGYRMILGNYPSVRDGFGWAVRLGFVLALSSSWPAFQTLVYRVAIDSPNEMAATLLPAIGLPADDIEGRIQTAYEAIGRGTYVEIPADAAATTPTVSDTRSGAQPAASAFMGQSPAPVAASLLILSSIGIAAALQLTAGFLVAIGPLALIGLLFDSTSGLVSGWARALIGAALGVLATRITSALELVSIESEIARAVDIRAGADAIGAADPQGFMTIASLFGIIALVAVFASFRAVGGLQLPRARSFSRIAERDRAATIRLPFQAQAMSGPVGVRSPVVQASAQTRVGAVSDALALAASREVNSVQSSIVRSQRSMTSLDQARGVVAGPSSPLGGGGRRSSARVSRSAIRRDISA